MTASERSTSRAQQPIALNLHPKKPQVLFKHKKKRGLQLTLFLHNRPQDPFEYASWHLSSTLCEPRVM